jgi:8-oxo-dGTP diphosphatase
MNTAISGKIIKKYPKKTFEHAVVAVDVVLFRFYKNELQVLLLELQENSFTNKWALPGGLVIDRENLEQSAERHLKNKTSLSKNIYLEQLYSFGNPTRDPLGWVVSVSYLGLTNDLNLKLKTTSRYKSLNWFSIKKLPSLAYDHQLIIETAVKRLTSKIEYTNIIRFLMKTEFTMSELRSTYEYLLGKHLDKRNFTKKILSLKILKSLPKIKKGEQHRPSRLYSFQGSKLKNYPSI